MSAFIRSPSTNSVLTHLGIFLFLTLSYSHSERVIHEPLLAFTFELSPAQHITLSSPVLSIFAELPDEPIFAELPDEPIFAESPDEPICAE